MFRHLQLKKRPAPAPPDPAEISTAQLLGDAALPIPLRAINNLPGGARQRLYRVLLPPSLLHRLGVHPVTGQSADGDVRVRIQAEPDTGKALVAVQASADADDLAFCLELADNSLNGVDLNLLLLNDPAAPRFGTDFTADGQPTYFGTVRRNVEEEIRAMQAGLAPGQVRAGLGASALVLRHLDAFLSLMAHQAVFLEPLTYASAWVFERRGFAYVRGHKLMQDIDREFGEGGSLRRALDGSTPFRQPDMWRTVRGRAWAIHDGILEVMGATWNNLRMVKQVGREAGVNTFPDAVY